MGRGRQNFDVNRKASSLWSFGASLKKSLQPLTLYTSFHDLINVYSRRSWEDNPQGTKFWCQQKPLVISVICYKFKTNLCKVWFYTQFFMILYMYITPGQTGADNPLGTKFWCQQEHLVTSVICYKFQTNLFEVWFYTIFSWFCACI